jgi:uncharacterized protein YwqG
MTLSLPVALEPFRERLLATRKPFVRVVPQKTRKTNLWESKVGGQPYLPKDTPYPAGPDGQALVFLAQLNFEDMPHIAPFPERGIVQFYINDDDLYGMDIDDGEKPDTFRVLYFPEVIKDTAQLQTKFPPLRDYEDMLPHHPEIAYPLSFAVGEEVVPLQDYTFWQVFGQDFFQQFGEEEWTIQEEYSKNIRSDGHKTGGYAYFTQDDPRTADDPMLLLFQLDCDEPMDLMWGDMGVGHFFIREKDLVAGNFGKVLYDWDCM